MNRFRFEFMDKARKGDYLPRLFDILYDNMNPIVPGGAYDTEKAAFLAEVGPALEKGPRKIILMYAGDELVGYFQYYVNGGFFMVEEIQIIPAYQSTTLLYALFRFLERVLPEDVETIGAYVHKENCRSRRIIRKLGMETEREEGDYCVCRGSFQSIGEKFYKKT